MSGVLPPVLCKVLSRNYAERLVTSGEMMWSTLTWFQNDEDAARGDASEGMRRYFPIKGLEITRLQHDGRPDNTKSLHPDEGMISKAKQSDHIFIYSMTLDHTREIGDGANRVAVEIFDPPTFVRHVREAVERHRSARLETLIHNDVKYWSPDDPPEEVWALPDRLTMHKHHDYAAQREYRLAFGRRANVFDFENIEGFVVHKDYVWPRLTLEPQAHRMKLLIGPLKNCCRLP